MAKGAPDFTKMVALYGTDGTDLVLVKLDSEGQLYALLMGDASGTPTAVKVNTDGELYTVLKAAFGGTLKDVAADTNGNLTLNLKAQDLSELINRPKYGAAGAASAAGVTCLAGVPKDVVTVSGRGITYGGHYFITETWNGSDLMQLVVDGAVIESLQVGAMFTDNFTLPNLGSMYCQNYDTVTPRFVSKLPYGWTFETSYVLKFTASTTDRDVNARVLYALV